jgi:hypothetical protein
MDTVLFDMNLFKSLKADEYELVASYAASLIRNRVSEHTEAYYKFKEMRNRMLNKNPMSDEEIDRIIHEEKKGEDT